MASPLPRVLIIGTHPLDRRTADGVTLTALFEDWPRDRLSQIHVSPPVEDTLPGRSYRLRSLEPGGGPLLWRQARMHWSVLRRESDTALLLGRISRSLETWLDEAPPDVVLCWYGSIGAATLAMRIAERYGATLGVYIPDDWMTGWPANVYGRRRPVLDGIAHALMERTTRRLVERASLRFSISEAMTEAYARRYAAVFLPVHNGVVPAAWPMPRAPRSFAEGEPMRVVYSGSLHHFGQTAALEDLRDAVARASQDGASVRLEIYSRQADDPALREAFDRPPVSRLLPLVPAGEVQANLRDADVLVLPVNFDATSRAFVRLSMPSKLAEYLASGTPLLAYGPPEVAQMRLLRSEDAAAIIDEPSVDRLVETLRTLRADTALRERLGQAARRAAERHFDIATIRERFQHAIVQAAPQREAGAR